MYFFPFPYWRKKKDLHWLLSCNINCHSKSFIARIASYSFPKNILLPSFQVRAQANQVDQMNYISKDWLHWVGYLCSNPHSFLGEKSHYIYNKIALFALHTLFHYQKDKQRWKMGLTLLFWYRIQSVLNIYFKPEKLSIIPQLTFYWFYGKVLLLKYNLLNEIMRTIT